VLLRPLKIRVPEVCASWIERADAGATIRNGARVLAIIAGPGFGKTVFASQLAAAWPGPVFWYACDEADADLAVFSAHLAEMLGDVHSPATNGPASIKEVARNTVEALARRRGALVIFDDIHVLRGPTLLAFRELIEFGTSIGASFVLSGRELPLPAHQLAARTTLTMLGGPDLTFDDACSRKYLKAAFGSQLEAGQIADLARQIGGWPAGLALAAAVPARELCGDALSGEASLEILFDYLAAEVLASLAEDDRRFLLEIAPLDDLEVGACNALAGTTDAHDRLARLSRRGLFLARSGARVFEAHRLFKSFLRDRLAREYSAEARAALHDRAARFFRQHGDDVKAIEHELAGGRPDEAATSLARVALPLLATGHANRLDRLLSRIGASRVAADPLLSVARGKLQQAQGNWDQALATLTHATTLARRHDLPDIAAEAVRAMAPILGARGERDRLGALIDGTFALSLSEAKRTMLCITLGAHLLECGRFDEVLELYVRISPQVEKLDDLALMGVMLHNTGVAHMRRGDPFAALHFYERAVGVKRAARQRVSAVVTLGNICIVLRLLGDVPAALRLSEECLREARLIGDATLLAHALENAGSLALLQDDLDAAARAFEEARSACDPCDAATLPYVFQGLATVALRRGDVAAAAAACARATALLRADANEHRQATLITTRARVTLAAGQPEAALALARTAVALADRGPDVLTSTIVRLECAQVAVTASATLEPAKAEDACAFGRDAARLALADAELREYAFLDRTQTQAVRAARSLVMITEPSITGLRILLLGPMRVFKADVEIDASAWKRRKAREILAYLVLERGRVVPRTRLVDILWPETEADAAGDNLRVAISAVRRAVGDVVRFESGGYRFVAPDRTAIDVDIFDDALAQARSAPDVTSAGVAYKRALHLYCGDLLDGFEDAAWHLFERARLRDGALEAARALLAHPATSGDVRARAIERLLLLDPFDVDAVRAWLDSLAATNRIGEARSEYERWRRRYTANFGQVAPDCWHPPRLSVVPAAPTERTG
jgi:ATP/maltotriose-dependent transcriptional regulator MalT/DNA-binding SARP family transcriptional activator